MVSPAFVLAASANFRVMLLSLLWSGSTTRGVVWGGLVGLVLTLLPPAIWDVQVR